MAPKKYKRGYPVAVLVGIEQKQAVLWQVFSYVAKHQQTVSVAGDRTDSKVLYNFHESIVNALRPIVKEGIKSIILASPAKTDYTQAFLVHVTAHHAWLTQGKNKTIFSQITGSATTPPQVSALTRTPQFNQLIQETASAETENLLEILEQRLSASGNLVRFGLEEAENFIYEKQATGKLQPEYLLVTDCYLSSSRQKSRLQRLMQIAANRKVKTRVLNADSSAGVRLTQLGGIVCVAKPEKF